MTAKIAIPDGANATERFAAEELARYVIRVTGAPAAIVPDGAALGEITLCIGGPSVNKAAATCWGSKPFLVLDGDAFTVQSADSAVVFAGGRPRATLYSVYAFLERYAGARWFHLDPAEEVIPFQGSDFLRRVLKEGVSIEEAPIFQLREIRLQPFFSPKLLCWYAGWMAKNRLNVAAVALDLVPDGEQEYLFRRVMDVLQPEFEKRGIIAHFYSYNWYKQAPSPDQLRKHPEWQALVGEERLSPHSETHPPICLSQPEAVRIFEDNVIRLLEDLHRSYPATRIFFFMPRYFHNTNWCECEACKMDIPLAVESELVNHVARRVREFEPEAVLVWNLGVQDRNELPMQVDLEQNVALFHERYLDADYTLPFTDPSNDPWWDVSLKKLQALKKRLGVPYAFHCEFANLPGFGPLILPLPYTVFELDYVHRHDVGYLIHHNEGFGDGWWVGGLPQYATARAQWNPNLDLMLLVQDYFGNYFGKAAHEMEAFSRRWDQAFSNKLFKSQHRNFNDPVASGGHGSKAQVARPASPDESPSFYQEAAGYNQNVLRGLQECGKLLARAREVGPDVDSRIERAGVMLEYVRREREMTASLLAVQLHRVGVQACRNPSREIAHALALFDKNMALLKSKKGRGLFWNADFWTEDQIRSFHNAWST